MATRLSDLPEELISNITCKLGDDKFALRATCRALERKSFHEFATEHFSSKCVHFTTDSLNALCGISRDERLSKYIREVSIVTALFSEQSYSCPGTALGHWKPSVRQSEAYKFYMNDQKTLSTTGSDRAMLAEAFKNLSSLKVIAFIDNTGGLKEGTDYRGGNKVLRQTGTHPINGMDSDARLRSPEFVKHHQHLWSTIIHAFADAHGHLSLEEFRTNFSSEFTFLNPLKQLSFDTSLFPHLSGVTANIARLHLHLRSPERKGYKHALANFTRVFSNVTDLSLDFDMKLGSGPLYHRFVQGINMSQLTKLSIMGLAVDAARLASSITRLRDIADLRFNCCDVASGTWPPVLKAMLSLEKLEHLHLMYLREAGHKSYFLKQRPDDVNHAHDHLVLGDNWSADDDLDSEDDDDSTDDSMPELQDADAAWISPGYTSQHGDAGLGDFNESVHAESGADDDAMPEYVPGNYPEGHGGERAFYICIQGHDKIVKRLPTFIEEYNTGGYMDEMEDGLGPAMAAGFPFGHGMMPVTLNGLGAAVANMPPPLGVAAMMGAVGNPFGPPAGTAPAQNNHPTGTNSNPFTNAPFALHTSVAPLPTTSTTTTTGPATTTAAPAANASASGSGWDHNIEDWEDEDESTAGDDVD